jgi:RNA polymerase sigma factor (sigma-70 family)
VTEARVEDLLRPLAPQVLAAVVRRYGHLDLAEDAVQEALLAAATQWPATGVPDNPRAWLITVASRRMTDLLRAEWSRHRREDAVAAGSLPGAWQAPPADAADPGDADDTLVLLAMCCHPALTVESQVALALRAVGGLSTAEIARAFLVPEATMTRRITRAKQAIRDSGVPFTLPEGDERRRRLAAILHVLYLVFTEGYASTSGPELHRVELTAEAIRLTRVIHEALPGDPELGGLLALMLLTDARRPARTGPGGELVPLDEQDRRRWERASIEEGIALVTDALPRGPVGPYQLQAAIAAVHDEAPTAADTDWPQIRALYEALLSLVDNPVARLNHVVAVAMTDGPEAGLARLDELATDPRLAGDRRVPAVRAHLLAMTGDSRAAAAAYREAARQALGVQRQRYLNARADRLDAASPTGNRPGA